MEGNPLFRLRETLYKKIAEREKIHMGENYDGTHTILPAVIRLEDINGNIIETHPGNPNLKKEGVEIEDLNNREP